MKKWALLFGVAAIVIGCGGGGGGGGNGGGNGAGNGGGNNGGNGGGGSTIQVAFPNVNGVISTLFLPGGGRDIDNSTAVLKTIIFQDGTANPPQTNLAPEVNLRLDQYNPQQINVQVPAKGLASRVFGVLTVNILRLIFDDGSTAVPPNEVFPDTTVDGPNSPTLTARVFPGRTTTVPLYLSTLMFDVTATGVKLNRDLFRAYNVPAGQTTFSGVLSDCLSFDISNVATKPQFPAGSALPTEADHVHFTGDFAALSIGGFNTGEVNGRWSVIGNSSLVEGVCAGPTTIPGVGGDQLIPFGTYYFRQADPRQTPDNPMAPITAMTGTWHNYTDMLSSMGTFEFVTMPSSSDDNKQWAIIFVRDGAGNITNMYFGGMSLNGASGADFGTNSFVVFPISQLGVAAPDPALALRGSFSNISLVNGIPRSGTYKFDTNQVLPSGFFSTGRFLVYRR